MLNFLHNLINFCFSFLISIFKFPNCIQYLCDENMNDQFIHIDHNNLSKEICNEIIKKFENDDYKLDGTFRDGQVNKEVKDTLDLKITSIDNWKEIDNYLFEKLHVSLDVYCNKLIKDINNVVISDINRNIYLNDFTVNRQLRDYGYQIQKYEKNKGHYTWHNDFILEKKELRYISFIWYLNDIIDGGESEFLFGKIKPTSGKLLFFPSTWTYIYRENVPISDNKYVIVGWLGI